jgi:hypothetical protein
MQYESLTLTARALECFNSGDFLKPRPLQMSGETIHQSTFVTVQNFRRLGIAARFLIGFDDAIYGAVTAISHAA